MLDQSTTDLRRRLMVRIDATSAEVWTPSDFADLASRAAIDKTLQRRVAAGELRRIDRGLYDKPRKSNLTGKTAVPDDRAVISAVTRRDQARVVVDGMTAANDLGLTTAVPACIEVLIDARLKPIRLGKQVIHFKSAASSRLYWAGRLPGFPCLMMLSCTLRRTPRSARCSRISRCGHGALAGCPSGVKQRADHIRATQRRSVRRGIPAEAVAEMRGELLTLEPLLPDRASEARLFCELALLEGKRGDLICLEHADRALAAHAETGALPDDRLYFMHLVCGDAGTAWHGGPRTAMHLERALARALCRGEASV